MDGFTVAILTASDKGARGEREDESGRVIRELVTAAGGRVIAYDVVPDDYETLVQKLREYTDMTGANLILTTGGTGLGPRDNTPEATLAVCERLVPGIAEAMRASGLQKTPHAMLSRAISGIRRQSLIINLPGSPKAVRENLSVVLPALPHALEVLCGQAADCAGPPGENA
ncbi:MAG TPA: MogA/MoaB family molybdenum cofactor biosynthesis protein [Firmicutes bacterium]|nr:MogA/MoaB family molybdenum cofactor biosynthesis protein [Bacillota bacterium]